MFCFTDALSNRQVEVPVPEFQVVAEINTSVATLLPIKLPLAPLPTLDNSAAVTGVLHQSNPVGVKPIPDTFISTEPVDNSLVVLMPPPPPAEAKVTKKRGGKSYYLVELGPPSMLFQLVVSTPSKLFQLS